MLRPFFALAASAVRLFQVLRPSKGRAAVTLALMLAAGALEGATVGMLVPLLTMLTGQSSGSGLGVVQRWVPGIVELPRTTQVLLIAIAIWLVVLVKNVMSYLAIASASKLRTDAQIHLRQLLLERVMHAPPATLEVHTSGEIASAFLTDASRVNRALDYFVSLLQRGTIAAAYLFFVLMLAWRLTLITILFGLVLGSASFLLSSRALRAGRELTAASSRLARHVTETVGGLRVVRSTASETAQSQSFRRWNEQQAKAEADAALSLGLLTGATETLGVAVAMALTALAYIAWLTSGVMDISRFLAFGFGLLRLLPAVTQVYGIYGALVSLGGSIVKTLEWLELPQYPRRPFGDRPLTNVVSELAFEDVRFEYTPGRAAIDGLSFRLPAGRTLAVVGSSGSGKSTLASLLLRLREPTSGRIVFDGVDHWEFDRASFHRTVACVEQDPFLFNASIAENVAFGAPWVGREDVMAALELVKLGAWVRELPAGVDTVLGERGTTVSGGQRQRLAIARAVVRDPKLLILDEPTSSLDAETEREVVQAIAAASAGRTTVIITHRPAAAEGATRTLRLAQGRVESFETSPEAGSRHSAAASGAAAP